MNKVLFHLIPRKKPVRPKICEKPTFIAECPSRMILDQIADKWSMFILAVLCEETLRFNEIKRRLDGITQKSLTQTLRRLERNGIIKRHVLPVSPVAVEYTITPLGRTLKEPFRVLHEWTLNHLPDVEAAQHRFDAGLQQEAT